MSYELSDAQADRLVGAIKRPEPLIPVGEGRLVRVATARFDRLGTEQPDVGARSIVDALSGHHPAVPPRETADEAPAGCALRPGPPGPTPKTAPVWEGGGAGAGRGDVWVAGLETRQRQQPSPPASSGPAGSSASPSPRSWSAPSSSPSAWD